MRRVGDLEIDQDPRYQDREWKAERLGWAALFVLIALAAAGLFGNGPISWSSASASDGSLEVSYERFGRRGGPQELTVRAEAEAATEGSWQIDVSRSLLAGFRVEAVMPEPQSMVTVGEVIRFTFSQADPSAGLDATFAVTPSQLWAQQGDIGVSGHESVTVQEFIFP